MASLVLGQSNLAAGATIGSNHNSRANDGEILAGRGFWPGLCTTLKHSCRFASFTLLVKGDYPAELDIPLPFSLLNDDRANDRLLVIPAYWWLYNMYALARNTWKFTTRDKRKTKTQHIEFDCLAPDTVEEIFVALRLLEVWTGKAKLRAEAGTSRWNARERNRIGRHRAIGADRSGRTPSPDLEILGENMEASDRPVVILKARQAYAAYREMLHYYAVKNLLAYLQTEPNATRQTMLRELAGPRERNWVNLGGQLVPEPEVAAASGRHQARTIEELAATFTIATIDCGKTTLARNRPMPWPFCWNCWAARPISTPRALWNAALDEAVRIQEYVRDQVYATRKKDYDNPFRKITFRNAEEMKAVLGTAEDNSFVKQVRQETEAFKQQVAAVKARG